MSATGVKFNFWDKTDSGSRSASTQLSSLEKTGSILIDYGRANFASSGTWGSISDNYVKVFTSICGAQAVKPDVTIIGGGVVGLSIYGDAVTAFSGISAMPHALNVTHHKIGRASCRERVLDHV